MTTGTADRRVWRRYSALVALVFGVLIVTGTTLSSIGTSHLQEDGISGGAGVVGTPRAIRSDEFLRTSVWRIGALSDRGTRFATPLAAEGEILTATVTRGIVSRFVLGESFLVDLGSILPDQVGFALIWWAPSLLFWLCSPRLFSWFGMTPGVAVSTAALMYLAPSVMWWSIGPINSGLATSVPAALLLLHGSRLLSLGGRAARPLVAALACAVGAGLLIARVPFAYAPWAIPTSAGVLVPALVVAAQRFGWRGTLRAFALAGGVAVIGIVATVLEHRAGFDALRGTLYPGARRATARSLDVGILFGAPHLGVLKSTGTIVGTNASEVTSAMSVLALPCVLYAAATVDDWKRRLTAAWWGHAAVLAVFFFWVAVDLPAVVGASIPVLSLTTPERTAQVVGLVATAWFGVTVSALRDAPLPSRARLAGVAAVAVGALLAVAGASLRRRHLPDLAESQVLVGAAVVAAGVAFAFVLAPRQWSLAPLAGFLLIVAAGVNPITNGLADLRSSSAARTVRAVDRTEPGYWLTNSVNVDGLLMANAVPSLSGQQWTGPDPRAWRKLDPSGQFEGQWNRGASFISFEFDAAATSPRIEAPQADVIKVFVDPCDPRLDDLGAEVVVSTVPLEAACLELRTRFTWVGTPHLVYARDGGSD